MRLESPEFYPATKFAPALPGNRYQVLLDGVKPPHLIVAADEEAGEVIAHEIIQGVGPNIVGGKPVEIRLTGHVTINVLPEQANG